jgi:hypothetical protein
LKEIQKKKKKVKQRILTSGFGTATFGVFTASALAAATAEAAFVISACKSNKEKIVKI